MSGAIGATDIVNGDLSDGAAASDLVAVQTASTHVGTPSAPILFFWNGCMLQLPTGVAFIATADLYAALNSSSTASPLISWSD